VAEDRLDEETFVISFETSGSMSKVVKNAASENVTKLWYTVLEEIWDHNP